MKEKRIDKVDLVYKWLITLFILFFSFIFGELYFKSLIEKILIYFLGFANLLTVIVISAEYNSNKNK